jgi:hypothetical protein
MMVGTSRILQGNRSNVGERSDIHAPWNLRDDTAHDEFVVFEAATGAFAVEIILGLGNCHPFIAVVRHPVAVDFLAQKQAGEIATKRLLGTLDRGMDFQTVCYRELRSLWHLGMSSFLTPLDPVSDISPSSGE